MRFGKDKLSDMADNLSIKNATEQIEMEDTPTVAIKHKKDSSMVVGFNMLKNDEGDVFVSAGKIPCNSRVDGLRVNSRHKIVRVVDVVARKVLKLDMLEHGSGHRRDPADGAGDTFFPELFGKLH